MSYENITLYIAATPQYDDVKDDWNPELDANNPNNFNDFTEDYI